MKKLIIGILGESKCGKDWLGKIIVNNLEKQFYELEGLIKAADIIKEIAEDRYPKDFSIKDWENSGDSYREEYVKAIGKTRRQLLQDLGDELLEENPDYVYSYIYTSIKESKSELVLVTDVRNEKESQAVIDTGGIIIKVDRPFSERYPKKWKRYEESLPHPPLANTSGFKDFLYSNYPKVYKKINHISETSVEEVPDKMIHFKYFNSSKNKGNSRRLSSLIRKLKAI
jgi:hypothetical protein